MIYSLQKPFYACFTETKHYGLTQLKSDLIKKEDREVVWVNKAICSTAGLSTDS